MATYNQQINRPIGAILKAVSPETGILVIFQFDTVTAESHDIGSQISTHAVQSTASIVDHVRPEVTKLNLSVVITNTPLKPVTLTGAEADSHPGTTPRIGGMRALEIATFTTQGATSFTVSGGQPSPVPRTSFLQPLGPLLIAEPQVTPSTWRQIPVRTSMDVLQFSREMNRPREALENLVDACHRGVPFEITTDLAYYPQMLLQRISAPRENHSSVTFTLEFMELKTVEVQETTVQRRKPKKPASVRAKPQEFVGKRRTPEQFTTDRSTTSSVVRGRAGALPQ